MDACPYCRFSPIRTGVMECPRCHTALPSDGLGQNDVEGTRLESVEDVRRLVDQERGRTIQEMPQPAATHDASEPFRPLNRPPMATICVLDDMGGSGEWYRVRAEELVVGRVEADIVIPHDGIMSGRHFRLFRLSKGKRFSWRVQDLRSTNGTYARVSSALLKAGQEFIIGMSRYRFDACGETSALADETPDASPVRNVTQGWQTISPDDVASMTPSLVELTTQGEGKRIALTQNEAWIGADSSQCFVTVTGDRFVSPRHARVYRDDRGRWLLGDGKSRNGTWLRIQEIAVRSIAELQAGEQRFLIKVLNHDD